MKRYKATASTVHFYLDENGPWCDVRDVDAHIAELTAEVERYKAAMKSIVDDYKQAFHTDWTTAANYADIARNALREGNT